MPHWAGCGAALRSAADDADDAPSYTQPSYTQPSYTQPSYTQPSYTQPPYTQVESSRQVGAVAFSKAEKVAKHFLNLGLSRAFHTLKELVGRNTSMRTILRRLKYPALGAALGAWKAMVEACHEHARKLRRAANFMVNGTVIVSKA